jgi:DNA-binding NarL/FixJ family response regulator
MTQDPSFVLLVISRDQLEGLSFCALLRTVKSISVFHTNSLHAANVVLPRVRPDVIVWMTDLVDTAMLQSVTELREHIQRPKICLLTRRVDASALRDLLSRTGADRLAILPRDSITDLHDILRTLAILLSGRIALTPRILDELLMDASLDRESHLQRLTTRELNVLALLALGLRNHEIARRLNRSEKSIEGHVRRIFSKLDLNSDIYRNADRRVTAALIYHTYHRSPQRAE